MLSIVRRLLCNHMDRFSYRKYNDFDFIEYNKCSKCGKILDYIKGYDEDLRG